MKTKHFVCVLAVFALLICVGSARADTLFSYDFENPPVTTGNIVGQDNWVATGLNPANWYEAYVGTGAGINTSQVFLSNPVGGSVNKYSGAKRPHATPLTFSSDDTAIELNFWGRADRGAEEFDYGNLFVTMMWEGVSVHLMASGISYDQLGDLTPETYFRNAAGTITRGDTLVAGHWYEIKSVMDFSTVKLDYYYRDVTAGDTEFTADGTLQNLDMSLTPDGSGQFKSEGICAYVIAYTTYVQHQYIDNISVYDPVPEPSTLALLASGLIGLLAYAWRKRK